MLAAAGDRREGHGQIDRCAGEFRAVFAVAPHRVPQGSRHRHRHHRRRDGRPVVHVLVALPFTSLMGSMSSSSAEVHRPSETSG